METSNVVPLFGPDAPLRGRARIAAISVYREALPEIAAKAIGDAFSLTCRLPGCADLSIEDALPMFVSAFRQELDKPAL
jgi:hypothetical protein